MDPVRSLHVPTWSFGQLQKVAQDRIIAAQYTARKSGTLLMCQLGLCRFRRLLDIAGVVSDAPTSFAQHCFEMLWIHLFGAAVYEHVFCRGPVDSGSILPQHLAYPCHAKCQGFLASVCRCIRHTFVEDILCIGDQTKGHFTNIACISLQDFKSFALCKQASTEQAGVERFL